MVITEGRPDKHESLRAGAVEIPCEVFKLMVKVLDRWYSTEGYSPIFPGYENLIGRQITNQLNLCMRGPEKQIYAASEQTLGNNHRSVAKR